MENLKKDGFALRAGFSLIELLIVITIIGILAVAFLPSITEGPSRARDTQRIADMSDIALALELYYQDTGSFPSTPGVLDPTSATTSADELASYFDNNTVPTDPQESRPSFTGDAGFYYYTSCNSHQGYVIVANPENDKTTENYYDTLATICTPSTWGAPTIGITENYYVLHKVGQ